MALSITLTDETNTIDLLAAPYSVAEYSPRTSTMRDGKYQDITESLDMTIQAASKTALQAAVQTLETMVARAYRPESERGIGPRVWLQMQVDGDTEVYRSEVLNGRFQPDGDALITWAGATITGLLTIERRFFWEGAEKTLLFAGGGSTAMLRNTDNTSPYNVATFGDVDGVIKTPIKLTLTNATGGSVAFTDVYVATDDEVGFAGTQHLITPLTATTSWIDESEHNLLRYDIPISDAAVAAIAGRECHIIGAFSNSATSTFLRASLRFKAGGVYNELSMVGVRENFTGVSGNEVVDFGSVAIPPPGAGATTGLTIIITAYSKISSGMTLDFATIIPSKNFKRLFQTGYLIGNGDAIVDDCMENKSYVLVGATENPIIRRNDKPLLVFPGKINKLYMLAKESGGYNAGIVFMAAASYRPRRLTV